MTTITGSLKVGIRKQIRSHGDGGEYPKGTSAELRQKSQTAGAPKRRGRRGGKRKKKKGSRAQAIVSWDLYVNGELARSDLTEMEAFSYLEPADKLAGPAP